MSRNISDILLLSLLKVWIIIMLFTILADLIQFICWKILSLMIVGVHKMCFKEINIQNRVCNYYFDYLIKEKKLESKNILINEKNSKVLVNHFTRFDCGKSVKVLSLL